MFNRNVQETTDDRLKVTKHTLGMGHLQLFLPLNEMMTRKKLLRMMTESQTKLQLFYPHLQENKQDYVWSFK